jgi:ketosteroid isomerase-like protein
MSEELVEIVRAAMQAFNRRDFDAALESASEDVTWAPFIARTETPMLRGKDEIRGAWERQFDVMDLHIESFEILAHDDARVVTLTHLSGRGHGSEASVDRKFAQVITFEEGRLRAVESYDDTSEALRAAGIDPDAA